jgi:hypothetical protein
MRTRLKALMPWYLVAVQVISALGIPAIVVLAVKLVWSASALQTEVHTIKTNHLPHLEKDIQELRSMFVAHIDKKSE